VLQRHQPGRCARTYAVSENGTCRRAPDAASGWLVFSLDAGHGQHGLAAAHANGVNPYWGEIEHYHNFSRKRLYALLQNHGFKPADYHISERYRVCMEVIAIKQG
jgi:hypothetical protein